MDKEHQTGPAAISVAVTFLLTLIVVTLLVLLAGGLYWYLGADLSTDPAVIRRVVRYCAVGWIAALGLVILGFIAAQFWLRRVVDGGWKSRQPAAAETPVTETLGPALQQHLRRRYGLFWRGKTRMLLVVGEAATVAQLAPGLPARQWLEGDRTVLIYGGDLTDAPDAAQLSALRKLRRTRPLDGIIRVLAPAQPLTPQRSDHDLRQLEQISAILRWQPPVWLWQVCDSAWSQEGRAEQAVGITLPARPAPGEVVAQLNKLLPQLRRQGLAQLAEDSRFDFLLRLAQRLEQGGSARWQQLLTPWREGAGARPPLRGLMFSLAAPATMDDAVRAEPPPWRARALILSASWQGVLQACGRLRGQRVGLPWERIAGQAVMALLLLWGAGMAVSFLQHYGQISAVATRARQLVRHPATSDAQLTALHTLRNDAGRLQQRVQNGAPWYQRFGLDHSAPLLRALLPWYGVANNRLIRDPASQALRQKLQALINTAPGSLQRAGLAKGGYDQLKAWLMMARPDKADATFYVQTMQAVQPAFPGLSASLWQSLAPDLWAFYIRALRTQPQWAITPDATLVIQSRQALLQQLGHRNAESTLYQTILKRVRRNYADLTLEAMTGGTDARRLFSSDAVVPGMFTRQAWEGEVRQAIAEAARARREAIDWVLSDSRQQLTPEVSPEVLQARLTRRYFTDFAGSWLGFLNSLRWRPAHTIADVTDQLTLISDVRQSPLIALLNTLAWQGQTGQKGEGLSDSLIKSAKALVHGDDAPAIDQHAAGPSGPLDESFGPLLALMGKKSSAGVMAADSSLSLQTWLTRITRVRLRLQQIAGASDPQEMMQALAQTVFQGKDIDLTDTRQYGSLIAASLGEEWSGFGRTMFVQPLTQAWQTVLQPSAASLNAKWQRAVVNNWRTAFDGRYPFAASKSEASLPMLAEFIRRDTGRIERFLNRELSGVLHKEGSQWVPDKTNSQGLQFNPAFLRAVNQLSRLSDILFTDGSQGISFELQARPAPQVVETTLTIDGQRLRYFNQMADWQTFRWPGDTYKPGAMLTWNTTKAGARLFGDYKGTWGFIRWLEQGSRQRIEHSQWMLSFKAPDGHKLQWVLRSQLGNGPLALLQLRNFTLPMQIFSVSPGTVAQLLDEVQDDIE